MKTLVSLDVYVIGGVMLRKITSILFLILWMIVIFIFSSFGSVESNNTSGIVISSAISIKDKVTNKETEKETKKKIIKELNYFVRKSAHVFEYFVLGILTLNVFDTFNIKRKVLFSIILCILYASSDEFHQIFTGRTASIADVLLDSIASIVGIFLLNYIFSQRRKRKMIN